MKKIGSGQDQDICLISITNFPRRVIQDVTNDIGTVVFSLLGFLCSQKIKIFLSVCGALIAISNNSCYFIVIFSWRSGSSKLLL